jgi:hypothetical protein
LFWYACVGAISLIDARVFSDGVADVLLSAYHQHFSGIRHDNVDWQRRLDEEKSRTYLLGSNGLGSKFSLSTVLPSIMRIRGVPGE